MRSLLGRFHRPFARGVDEQLLLLNNLGDGSTLSLDFTTGVLDPRLTFTRSTTGTFTNASGLVASAAINTPRFDYDPTTRQPRGLLIEGSSDNTCRNSNDIYTTGFWGSSVGISVANETGIADPSGGTQTCRIVKAAGVQFNVRNQVLPTVTVPANSTVNVTASLWMRMNGAGQTAPTLAIFDLGGTGFGTRNGVYVSNPAVTASSGSGSDVEFTFGSVTGWVRVGVTRSITNATASPVSYTQLSLYIYPDRFSTNTATIFVWGAQFEIGIGMSSLIPTGASTGSRAADSCVMTGTNFSSWFTQGEGTIVAQSDNIKVNGRNLLCQISNAGSTYIQLGNKALAGAGESIGYLVSGSIEGYADSNNNPALNTAYKTAYVWSTNYFNVCVNGTLATADTSGNIATSGMTQMVIGADATPPTDSYIKNGHIRSLKYYPTRLANAQLQALTT
jgi:hypothetical protein